MNINKIIYYSDVEVVIRRSQEPMVNVLILSQGLKRSHDVDEVTDQKNFGECSGGHKKVRHVFKDPTEEQKVSELSNK